MCVGMCMRGQRWISSAFLYHPPSSFLREGLSLILKLVGLARLVVPWAVDLPVSASPAPGSWLHAIMPSSSCGFQAIKPDTSWLLCKPFTNWDIFPASCSILHAYYTHSRDAPSVMLLGKLNHINDWDAASVLGKFIGGGDKHINKQHCDLSAGLTHPVLSACCSLSSVLT